MLVCLLVSPALATNPFVKKSRKTARFKCSVYSGWVFKALRQTIGKDWKYNIQYVFISTVQTECLFTKHELLRVWKTPGAPATAQLCKTKHQLQKWSPLNAYKHIKQGCIHCPSMTAFMGGVRNERLRVQRDNATSRAIITQVCGWDEASKAASATGMTPLCCQQKSPGLYQGGWSKD